MLSIYMLCRTTCVFSSPNSPLPIHWFSPNMDVHSFTFQRLSIFLKHLFIVVFVFLIVTQTGGITVSVGDYFQMRNNVHLVFQ